ncbi:hypothetical protein JW906_15525 [bacterium]|nr:hypothetical protein [bacterium]
MGNLMKIVGLVQGAVGALGTAPTGLDNVIKTAQGGDIFNLISGVALGFLGMKGSSAQQKVGIPAISGLNGIVGLLGLLGANNPLAALQMNNGTAGSLINIAISAIGFISTFMKKKAA